MTLKQVSTPTETCAILWKPEGYLVPDLLGLECELNLYAYVENDPANWSDPEGLI